MNDSTKHHNELSFQAKKTMISRIVVGLVLVLVLFPLIFIGDYLFFAGILVLMGIGEFEIINTIKPKNHKYSLKDTFNTYFPSSIINELNLKIINIV